MKGSFSLFKIINFIDSILCLALFRFTPILVFAVPSYFALMFFFRPDNAYVLALCLAVLFTGCAVYGYIINDKSFKLSAGPALFTDSILILFHIGLVSELAFVNLAILVGFVYAESVVVFSCVYGEAISDKLQQLLTAIGFFSPFLCLLMVAFALIGSYDPSRLCKWVLTGSIVSSSINILFNKGTYSAYFA